MSSCSSANSTWAKGKQSQTCVTKRAFGVLDERRRDRPCSLFALSDGPLDIEHDVLSLVQKSSLEACVVEFGPSICE